jgi:Uma2 family endonuclease
MATTTSLLTWQEFERLPGEGKYELIEGRLTTLPPPKRPHSRVSKRLFLLLHSQESKGVIVAYYETGFKLSNDPPTWLQPDVSLVTQKRDREGAREDYFSGAPDLAVEVVSPSDTAEDLNRRVHLFLKEGSRAVWVIYPDNQSVVVYRPDGTGHTLGIGDTLTLPSLLPDWQFPVAQLFEE